MIAGSFIVLLVVCIANRVTASLIMSTREVTATEGQDVKLLCIISDPSLEPVMWQNGSMVISMNRKAYAPPTDDKFSIVGDRDNAFNLLLKRVTIYDEGNYSCQVPGKVTYVSKLIINVPPSIKFNPEIKKKTVQEDEELRLECLASGKPQPSINWTFSGYEEYREYEHSRNSTLLIIEEISRADAGIFTCTADNGVGVPARHSIQVEVQFAPTVIVKSHFVHAIPEHDATGIECIFVANPDVEVEWRHNNTRIDRNWPRNVYSGHVKEDGYDKWTLDIKKLQPTQFGYYTCVGGNKHGTASDTVVLTPLPVDLKLVSTPEGKYSDRYTVQWAVFSHSKLVDFMIAFKQLNESFNTEWHNFSIPSIQSHIPDHTQEYTFNSLEANSSYKILIKAENEYGYSDWSKEFIFHTASVSGSRNAFSEPGKFLAFILTAVVVVKNYWNILS